MPDQDRPRALVGRRVRLPGHYDLPAAVAGKAARVQGGEAGGSGGERRTPGVDPEHRDERAWVRW